MNISKCYAVLELKETCSKEDIKASFRRLAMIHHPDRGGTAKKFIEVKKAYDTLVKRHVQKESDGKVYPYWKNGWLYYWPGDTGTYVGYED